MYDWSLPRLRRSAWAITRRNLLVWKRLLGPAIVMNFGEPTLYLLGLGLGLGHFVGEMGELSYLAFLASGIVASSAMTTASFEGMYSVYTRMVPQRTYDAMLATPLEVDDIIAGEMLWCGIKAVMSGAAIIVVATLLGVVAGPGALLALPVIFLTGLCFAGPAMVMSSMASNYDFFNYYFVLVLTPMLLVSGVFYPLDSLPPLMQQVVQVLPLAHAIQLTRPLVAGGSIDGLFLHLGVLAAYATISYYLAVVLVRRRLLV